jgi:hypothetical protein
MATSLTDGLKSETMEAATLERAERAEDMKEVGPL